MRMNGCRLWGVLTLGSPVLLHAQNPLSVAMAEASITATRLLHTISVISDDSTLGRATPSPGLDKAARFVAEQFRQFGLTPGGDDGTYLQHYPLLLRQIDTAQSTVSFQGPVPATLQPGTAINVLRLSSIPEHALTGPVVVFAGPLDPSHPFDGAKVRDAWVGLVVSTKGGALPVPPWLVDAVRAAGALGVVFLSDRPDASWAAHLSYVAHGDLVEGGIHERPDTTRPIGFVELRDDEAAPLLGLDIQALRASGGRSARPVPGVSMTYRVVETQRQTATAANVVAILEGRDPDLRHEYVVLSGHLDHLGTPGAHEGCFAQGADSICNGADDDASGAGTVVALAQAFSRLSPHPRRSVIFITVSGEERGLWGSRYYVAHGTAPITQIVADIQSDMVGRNSRDTVAAVGLDDSDLGATLIGVSKAHPELHMTPVSMVPLPALWSAQRVYRGSDHYEFARHGVPALFFFSGLHDDYHRVSDEVAKIDGEKTARIARLEFHLALTIANAPARPAWNEASYRAIVGQ